MSKRLLSLALVISILLSLAAAVNACNPSKYKKDNGRKKVVMVIAESNFEDVEFYKPKEILENHGVKVTVASTTTKAATGTNGGTYKPDILIQDVRVHKYDAVIVIGGTGIMNEWDNLELRSLIINADKQKKIVAAICAAPPILARAGILKGKDATCFPWSGIYDELTNNGANYVDSETVRSGNIITGRNPDASEAFGIKLCEALKVLGKPHTNQ
ncbi:MAG TPA: DJ-1/PfpI family protein [Pseudobacteroides sp.]|uniref:DJ-1/PfpI family protein n=1 Tax=Pseudobacteroides sp. TaxID=1968840 RepID=UPI002F954EDA